MLHCTPFLYRRTISELIDDIVVVFLLVCSVHFFVVLRDATVGGPGYLNQSRPLFFLFNTIR